ncbi:HNH endonuclease [Nocardiopsis synnemataformans]|uniref:HNH endonuclease n=1 Tax=Nocardiopsis synnemataformans TaxID=61305 RepID=UPI003EBD087E
MNTGPTRAVREAVWRRDAGSCAWCGATISGAHSLQHRRARGMGGSAAADTNTASNLVLVCGTATTGCHRLIEAHPAAARARGFRVDQGRDPAAAPITYQTPFGAVRVLLAADGTLATLED